MLDKDHITDHHQLKEKQRDFANRVFESREPVPLHGYRYHDHYREEPFLRMSKLLNELNTPFQESSPQVQVAACGSGIDIHYLKKHFPKARPWEFKKALPFIKILELI